MAKTKKSLDQMSFLDHLEEFRWVLVRSSIAIVAMAIIIFAFSGFIFDDVIFGPIQPSFPTYRLVCDIATALGSAEFCIEEIDFVIQNTSMEGQVTVLIWACITGGIILGFPFILWELWKFVKPALYEKERKMAKVFIGASSLLFFAGVLFGYYIIVPMSIHFFATFSVSDLIKNEFNLSSYIGMLRTAVLACGLFFELPIIIYFLSRMGLVTAEFLRKYRKYAIVIVLIVAAVVTPPDVISQIIVAIPMLIIYELSIYISAAVARNKAKEALKNTV